MRTFATEFDLEIIYMCVLYKSTQNSHSFNRNGQNHTGFTVFDGSSGRLWKDAGGQFSFYLLSLVGAGGIFPTPTSSKHRVSHSRCSSVQEQAPLLGFLSRRACCLLLS